MSQVLSFSAGTVKKKEKEKEKRLAQTLLLLFCKALK
jgi:hypothetical protein